MAFETVLENPQPHGRIDTIGHVRALERRSAGAHAVAGGLPLCRCRPLHHPWHRRHRPVRGALQRRPRAHRGRRHDDDAGLRPEGRWPAHAAEDDVHRHRRRHQRQHLHPAGRRDPRRAHAHSRHRRHRQGRGPSRPHRGPRDVDRDWSPRGGAGAGRRRHAGDAGPYRRRRGAADSARSDARARSNDPRGTLLAGRHHVHEPRRCRPSWTTSVVARRAGQATPTSRGSCRRSRDGSGWPTA